MTPNRVLILVVAVCVCGLVYFNTQLLSGCDHRIEQVIKEKDQSVRTAMEQMRDALAEQEAALEELRMERASSRSLKRKMQELTGSAAASSRRISKLEPSRAAAEQVALPTPDSAELAGTATAASTSSPQLSASGALVPSAIAVVVIAYNRPAYLNRALSSIFKNHPGGDAFPVYVSQDGENGPVSEVAKQHGAHSLIHPRRALSLARGSYLAKFPGYAYLSVHYGWALRTLFETRTTGPAGRFAGVIVLEEDIEIAPDFFSYFNATAPLLERDPSLLCVSAFNDNGQGQYAGDPQALHRSDFFPGLGWLLTRALWEELAPKWPEEKGFWDDWLREPAQRQGRVSIRPEVSRTFTFGEKGTSVGQFYGRFLGKIQLEQRGVRWQSLDLSFLIKEHYDRRMQSWLDQASVQSSMAAARRRAEAGTVVSDLKVLYHGQADLVKICKSLGLMEDLKAGVPRTAYRGVVIVRINGVRIFIAPSYTVNSPPGDITVDGHGIQPGRRGILA